MSRGDEKSLWAQKRSKEIPAGKTRRGDPKMGKFKGGNRVFEKRRGGKQCAWLVDTRKDGGGKREKRGGRSVRRRWKK